MKTDRHTKTKSAKSGTHQFWKLTGIFMDTFLLRNIVLVQAIGLCPIIAVGVNLQYGVVLTLCTAAVLLPCSLCMSFFGDRFPDWLRAPTYTVGASVLLIGAAAIVDRCISNEVYAALYLFLPLMAVNTIFTYRAGGFSVSNRPAAALVDALGSSLGFGIVICVVSALRELASFGTLWNIPVGLRWTLPEAALPYAAFIILGFMAAFLQWVKSVAGRMSARRDSRVTSHKAAALAAEADKADIAAESEEAEAVGLTAETELSTEEGLPVENDAPAPARVESFPFSQLSDDALEQKGGSEA